jgi:MFS family permease
MTPFISKVRAALNGFFALPAGANVHPEIAQHFRHNFIVNMLDMTLWWVGISFISVSTILPVYVRRLTDSPILIGLIPALVDAGWFLPQLFFAPFVERLPRKLPTVLGLGALERVPFAVMPFVVWWIGTANVPPNLGVTLFLGLIAWRAIGGGMVAAPWQELIAKVIPATHRGRFFGLGFLAGQLLGIGGAAVAAALLAHWPYPQNFVLCFGAGAVFIWLSIVPQLFTREPAFAPPVTSRLDRAYAQRLLTILKENANYRTFLISRLLSYGGGMAIGFLAVYAVERYQLDDSVAGVFTAILLGASVLGNAVWGPVGDRMGHKRVLEAAVVMGLIALGIAAITPVDWGFYLVFALMGLSNSAGILSDLSLAMEFGPDAERPTYIGLTRTVTGPALLIAPVFGGWLAQTWGYPVLFGTSFALTLAGGIMLVGWVRDPRRLVEEERRTTDGGRPPRAKDEPSIH